MKKITLKTKRLILTEWENSEEDINVLIKNFNDENIYKTLLNPPYPYTQENAETWLKTREKSKEKGDYCFKIINKKNNKIIGHISLDCRNNPKTAEVGYWIEEESWKNGYATEALKAIIKFGFETLELHKICSAYYKDNPASGRVMQKCNMEYEGTQKEQIFKNGIYHDKVLYGIINKKEK